MAHNLVEYFSEGLDDCAWDQPCKHGHRVGCHAVYCHNDAWLSGPKKCGLNRTDFIHEDCPGFEPNPAWDKGFLPPSPMPKDSWICPECHGAKKLLATAEQKEESAAWIKANGIKGEVYETCKHCLGFGWRNEDSPPGDLWYGE